MRKPILLPAAAMALTAVLGCGDDSAGPGGSLDYDSVDPIVFTQHVQPILQADCSVSGCHSGAAPPAGLSLESHDALAAGSAFGSVVIPGHPERSHLYLHLSGQVPPRMPFERDPLDDAVIRFFERWIAGGAAFDDGTGLYSDVARKAFIACQGEDLVAVMDMDPATIRRGRVIGLLDVQKPHSAWVDPISGRLYVSRFETATDNIRVYDAHTHQLLETAQAGTYPALLKTTPDGSQLWVTNFDASGNDDAVRVFDPSNLGQGPITSFTYASSLQPHGLAMTGDGARVFVTNIRSSTVSAFATNAPGGVPAALETGVPLPGGGGQQPQQCVLSADETRLFVSALGSNQVHVLDVAGIGQGGWSPSWKSVTVGTAPWHLAVSPSGTELWVVNWVGETVSVVDVTDPDQPVVTQTLKPMHPRHAARYALERPMGVAFSPDGTLAYVTSTNDTDEGGGHHPPPAGQKNPGSVAIFEVATKQLVTLAEVPNFARFITFLP